MKTFQEWLQDRDQQDESMLQFNEDQMDEIIGELQKIASGQRAGLGGKIDFRTISSLAYNYLTKHDKTKDLVRNMLKNDPNKYQEWNAKYKELLGLVTNRLSQINWSSDNNGAWQQYNRGGKTGGVKDDNMTTKRYISINSQDIWNAFQKLPLLAMELNKVQLRPEADVLSFKIPTSYGAAIELKDTIVIHFYDKSATPQVDNAVQQFLNGAGIKAMDRSKFGRVDFGKDISGESDSQIIADRFAKYIELNKDKINDFLKIPNLKQQLDGILNTLSLKSSHRAGVKV